LTGFAIKKVEKEDHDDKNDCPEDQIFIEGAQAFSSKIKFKKRLT
jgi:hypothetical protein